MRSPAGGVSWPSVRGVSVEDLVVAIGEDPQGWFEAHGQGDGWERLEAGGQAAQVRDGFRAARLEVLVARAEGSGVDGAKYFPWAAELAQVVRRRVLDLEVAAAERMARERARRSQAELEVGLRDREAVGRGLVAVWSMWPGRYVPELDPSKPIELDDLEVWMEAHGVKARPAPGRVWGRRRPPAWGDGA